MKFNNIINTKALSIINEKKQIDKYLHNCTRANICPKCGENLILRDYTQLKPSEEGKDIYRILECSKNISHIQQIRYYDNNDDD